MGPSYNTPVWRCQTIGKFGIPFVWSVTIKYANLSSTSGSKPAILFPHRTAIMAPIWTARA